MIEIAINNVTEALLGTNFKWLLRQDKCGYFANIYSNETFEYGREIRTFYAYGPTIEEAMNKALEAFTKSK